MTIELILTKREIAHYNEDSQSGKEIDMFPVRSVLASALSSAMLIALLAGCDRAETPPAPTTGDSPGTSGSVASPPSSMPAPETSTPPAAPDGASGDSGDASGPTQAHPKDLSKQEESTTMPNSGQANNHSTANPVTDQK